MSDRPVVALAGRRIDAPNAAETRFAPADVDLVHERVRKQLETSRPAALVCAAACGADLLALEAAGTLGIRRRIVLPYAKETFRADSVVDRPGDWGTLFDRIVADVERRGDLVVHELGTGDAAYSAANRAILDDAASLGAGAVEAWIVWNGVPRGEDDITLQFADEAWMRRYPVRELLSTSDAQRISGPVEYERTCFVAMPFGTKTVDGKKIDFGAVYSTLIAPAIERVELPEGGCLRAYRTDRDPTAGLIDEDMFRCLEYSRFVFGDLTGLNPNVCIELGVRFRSRISGTVLFRQPGTTLPFDVAQVKVFDYDTATPALARDTVTKVLRESLKQNRLDSPVRRTLDRPRSRQVQELLRDAENALRNLDMSTAATKYAEASRLDRDDPTIWLRLATLEKDAGHWAEALEAARHATALEPEYGEAWRERGVAENQLWRKAARGNVIPNGIESLRRATQLNPKDFDAFASLGGALRREGAWEEALTMYRRSLAVSGNHPYPLLNVLKLEARVEGRLQLEQYRTALARAALLREQHVAAHPPYDRPWCFFDLIEIYLYQARTDDACKLVPQAIAWCDDDEKLTSFGDSLALLRERGIKLDGLTDILDAVQQELARRRLQHGR